MLGRCCFAGKGCACFTKSSIDIRAAGLLFADGGGLRKPSGELQSAAGQRLRPARLCESQNFAAIT